jgi:hypothetical protein
VRTLRRVRRRTAPALELDRLTAQRLRRSQRRRNRRAISTANRRQIDGAPLAPQIGMPRQIALLLLAACAGPTANEKPGPRGLRADQHLEIARREADRGRELAHWPDARPGNPGDQIIGVWSGTWDTTSEHQRMAEIHRSAAAELEAAYEEACGETPGAVAAVSPLERYGLGGSAIPDGTLVLLSPDAGPPDKLLAAMRCHRAWMMLGRSSMDDCPLDLPGLQVSARGDANGIELTLTVADRTLVPELQRRAAHDLEHAHHAER